MEHINEIELKSKFEDNYFEEILNNAMLEINKKNYSEEIVFELMETIININFNNHLGKYLKYRIILRGNLIGYLKAFKNNESNYLFLSTNENNLLIT